MQGKDFIYFLFDENNNSYYQYGDTVLLSSSLKPLEFTPDGWKKIQIQNQRNQTYFAVDRSFTVPLEYVKDGAQILKHIYYNFGVEAKVYMSICEQRLYFDTTHYGFYYTLLYKGEIDLSQFKHDSPKVTVNIMEGGMVKYIKAYENTKYEIPINVPDAIDILMDGIELKKAANYNVIEGQLSGANLVSHNIPILFLNQEGGDVGVIFDSQSFGSPDQRIISNESGVSITFPLSGSIKFKIEYAAQKYQLLIRKKKADNSFVTILDSGQISVSNNVVYTIPFSLTVTLEDNEELLFLGRNLSNASPANLPNLKMTYYETDINLNFDFKFRETTIKALRPLYVFQQLISKISNGAYTPVSLYLQNEIPDVVVTSGDAIRGIDTAVIKTSLRDFFTSFNSDFGLGMGMVNDILRLEAKGFWVQYGNFIDLGEVKNMKVSPANDLIVNNIKIGSPNQDYDDVNGKQEFNTTHEYSTPITRVAKELNLVSVYRKDCYGIEFTRLNLDGKTTTDNDSDNDVFMIQIEDSPRGDGFYHLDRSLNAGAAGLLTPSTVFNLYLTPARALRRNGDYIRSLFYKLDSKFLTFQTTDKNNAVVAGGIAENADVQLASFGVLFGCNYLEFETKVPFDLFQTLSISPLKAFAGTWLGFSFVGIPDKISIQPGDNGSQTFKLLASPGTDLTQLITIDG